MWIRAICQWEVTPGHGPSGTHIRGLSLQREAHPPCSHARPPGPSARPYEEESSPRVPGRTWAGRCPRVPPLWVQDAPGPSRLSRSRGFHVLERVGALWPKCGYNHGLYDHLPARTWGQLGPPLWGGTVLGDPTRKHPGRRLPTRPPGLTPLHSAPSSRGHFNHCSLGPQALCLLPYPAPPARPSAPWPPLLPISPLS